MFAAVLDRTRAFFDIPGGFSVFSALISGRNLGARNEAVGRNSTQQPRKRPQKRLALMASALLAPAALGVVFDPWKSTPSQSAMAEHGPVKLVRRRELLDKKVISQEEFDTFSTQVETRSATIGSSESEIARRRTNLDTRKAIVDAREATRNRRQANVD